MIYFLYQSPRSVKFAFKFLLFTLLFTRIKCWDMDELEIFDVVEEVNENFYTLMAIPHDAKLPEIKKAYRTLSKQLHPDKNDADDAELRFRNLVSVYEILRDDTKRARYDRVLVEGLPDWRSPIYYYRRARKMSLVEIGIILTVVISITQYLMAWGSYLDKKHSLEEFLVKKLKIKDKKKKKSEDEEKMKIFEEEMDLIPKPSWWNILPIQIVQLIIFLIKDGPSVAKSTYYAVKEEKEKALLQKKQEEEEIQRLKEEEEKRKERKAEMKTRKKVKVTVLPDFTGQCILDPVDEPTSSSRDEPEEPVNTGCWTENDFSELARLITKFPGGTFNRWDIIAEQMNRTVLEVTKMSKRAKAELQNRSLALSAEAMKQKAKAAAKLEEDGETDTDLGSDDHWTANQQKVLEKALKLYPKGTDQRWDKIANELEDKTKTECMMRFKYLAEKIRKKKEEEEALLKLSEEERMLRDLEEETISRYEGAKKRKKKNLQLKEPQENGEEENLQENQLCQADS